MAPVPPGSLVVLTGASGFVAKHVLHRLLADGYRVRATLRSPAREAEVRAAVLPGFDPEAGPRLSFATADLEADAGWDAAMARADALIHTASPFPATQPRDPQALIRPAVEGTRRALGAAARAGIARVVLTSSVVAVTHRGPPAVQDERDWSDPDDPASTPYDRSKTLAERAAWALAAESRLALTTICPVLVMGPLLDRASGTSVGLVKRLLMAGDPLVPRLAFSVVDARDVAAMHVRALTTPATEGERLLASAGFLPLPEMAHLLAAAYPDRRIPTRVAPDWLVRALAAVVPDLRTAVPWLGREDRVSSDKARALLGLDFIPPDAAVRATAESLLAAA